MKRHFASEEEIRSCTVNVDINRAIRALNAGEGWKRAQELCPAGGPVLLCNTDGTIQVMNDDSHSVAFASTGRGKTRRFVYPTMYANICAGNNLIVNDMKGEIYATTRGLLEHAGYTVYVLDLRDTLSSPNRYNPLDIAWVEWHGGRPDAAFMYLRSFALAVFDTMSKTTNDAFWPNSAIDYFMGLSLTMLEMGVTREEFTLESLARMDRMGNVVTLGSRTKLKELFEKFPPDSLALQSVSGTINAPNDTRSSILAVFRSPMSLYAGQRGLMDTLSCSDFDARELTLERRALFVISPDETHVFGPVVVGILNQIMSAMISVAQREYGGILPHRVDFILDEMGNLPARIPDMEALVSASRSRNMRFHFVLQSAAQLSNVYGNELREVILDNCDTWVYMGSRGLDFLKRISDLTGEVQLESGRVRPLMSVEKLQHLETRATETETLVFLSSLKPYVAPLKDVGQYEKPAEPTGEVAVKRQVAHRVFDFEHAKWQGVPTPEPEQRTKSQEEQPSLERGNQGASDHSAPSQGRHATHTPVFFGDPLGMPEDDSDNPVQPQDEPTTEQPAGFMRRSVEEMLGLLRGGDGATGEEPASVEPGNPDVGSSDAPSKSQGTSEQPRDETADLVAKVAAVLRASSKSASGDDADDSDESGSTAGNDTSSS